ncbi:MULTISPECIES: hypothetical protein [Streptomyces]|uniref:Secreted protein n=1 Tax=Streptomyces sanglieri TaxID=193460 RepID=A0ABW2X1H9_9ACTN|nr:MULTISPECIES: hypothetical protein [unclassified Streptomyces]WTB54062.1 hypothetical protein OG832_13205 [Streptomyces sp. NBC_00826]WTH93048.1 hypothetical protein OIC43_30470 [Streptomyces sp. NBC_00825]WTI01780.1 hypothetical protein OHA23_30450 [Streptomyces sp. NBC_00822]MCX4867399.1 hypothetical protein [Streptomyces sp. NBC_00906]MCX4898637.1 hypothetical protein [Streptomyces sp. NBC_00892]
MDPAVLAAIIPTPIALLAAGAAYAAGHIQGRSAYRGAVDAVRRQHQRDAYAAFLSAIRDYADQTEIGACQDAARRQVGVGPFQEEDDAARERVYRRASQIRAAVPLEPVRSAAAVIDLEGPKEVADLAQRAKDHARNAGREPVGPNFLERLNRGLELPSGTPSRLLMLKAIDEFTAAARDHLNGEKSPAPQQSA